MDVGTHQEWMEIAEARSGSAGHDKERCIGVFYDKAVQDRKETEIQGRAVFKNVPFVEILIPGAPNQRPNLRATDEYKARFPKAWGAYLERKKGLADGTPLEQWPYLNAAQVAELKHAGVYSVEQLSAVADGNLKNLGLHGRDLRDRAKQFLQGSSDTERELRETAVEQARKIANLEAKIEQLLKGGEAPASQDAAPSDLVATGDGMESQPNPAPKRRGRPPGRKAA